MSNDISYRVLRHWVERKNSTGCKLNVIKICTRATIDYWRPQNTWNHIFGKLKWFQNFLGDHAPSPSPPFPPLDLPRLAWAFGPRFKLRLLLCFIGHLWKILLRTLISYQERSHKDQETAPCRLHCTVWKPSLCDWNSTFIHNVKSTTSKGEYVCKEI